MFETSNLLHNIGNDDLKEVRIMFDHIKLALFHLLLVSSYNNGQFRVLNHTTIFVRDNFWCSKGKASVLEI